VDKNGVILTDENGEFMKMKPAYKYKNGVLVDSKGKPVLRKDGRPIK
jgi:flagellar basal body rod protein FlgG